ncbi:MAG TPA: hypothetical protein VIM70_04000 [Clostridium sp.]|uniref:hypothetical protein n=1 Tax=Clostridium sp. TaxID=1506 RepID=UPI002F92ACAA
MDNVILDILKEMQSDMKSMRGDMKSTQSDMKSMQSDMKSIKTTQEEHTQILRAFRT